MKRSFRLLTLICAAMSIFASCSKEPNDPNGQNQPAGPEPDKNYEYLFSLNEVAFTKANLSDQTILFEEGDKIGVIVVTPEKTSTITSEVFYSEDKSNIAFEITQKKGIEKDGRIYAFLSVAGGSESTSAPSETQVPLTIPTEQEQNETTYDADAMPLVSVPFTAESTLPTGRKVVAGELTMAALGAVAEFDIYSTFPGFADQQILSVEWTAEGLAGDFTWDFTAENPSFGSLTGNSAKTTVHTTESVAAAKENAAKIYMVVAPGQHAGAIKVKTTEAEYTLTLAEPLTFESGNITPVEINLENTTWSEAKVYRYRFSATAADNLFGTLSQPVGFFAGNENFEKALAEGTFTYDLEEALPADATVYAYYPYSAEATAANALQLNIPTTQTNPAEGGFDASYIPVVAAPVAVTGTANQTEANGTFEFHSLASIAKFNIHSAYAATVNEKIVSIKLDAEGIAGNFTWDLTAARSDWEVSGLDANSVVISPAAPAAIGADAENATAVYAVVAPGTYTCTLAVTTDKTVYEIELGEQTFARLETAEVDMPLPTSAKDFGANLEDFEIQDFTSVFGEDSTIDLYGVDQKKTTLTYSEGGFTAADHVKGPYYAIYPVGAGSVNFSDGTFTGSVAAEQTLAEGKNIAENAFTYFAKSNNSVLDFKNATSLVRVEVATDNVASITLKANEGQSLAGEFTLALTDEGADVTAIEEKGSQTVTLKPAGETFPRGEYYIAVLPGATENLTVEFTLGEEKETRTKAIETITRNTAKDLGLFFGYKIANAEQLLAWYNDDKNWTKWDTVTLIDDIDCAEVINSENWEPREFTGTFDGNNKTINNLVIEKEGPAAFFAQMKGNAFVKNLTFGEGCAFTSIGANAGGRVYAASLVCELKGNAGMDNITSYATIVGNHSGTKSKGNYIAGICCSLGGNKATVSNCKNYGSVTFSATPAVWTCVGGVFGETPKENTTIANCENYGAITFNGPSNGGNSINLGGIAGGANKVSFDGCSNFGKILYNAQEAAAGGINIGGIVGHNNSAAIPSLTNCTNGSATDNTLGEIVVSGATSGEIRMGGCVAYVQEVATNISGFKNYGKLSNSVSTAGTISMGGVVGRVNKTTNTITSCENKGTITNAGTLMTAYMGGMVGWLSNANTSLDNVSNSGAVTNNGAVTNTKTSGATTYIRLGGIVGYAQGGTGHAITNATNTVTIKNTKGGNSADIGNSIADLGGIIGKIDQSDLTIGNDVAEGVKNSGAILNEGQNTDNGLGGIVGSITAAANTNTIQNCFNSGRLYRNGWVNVIVNGHGFGGILGYHFATGAATLNVSNSKNTGTVEKLGGAGSNHHIAGIVGSLVSTTATCTLSGCTNEGNITYANGTESGGGSMANNRYCYTAGIVGHHNSLGEIINCTNSGIITNKLGTSAATGIRIGGIVGNLVYANMTKCKNAGEVKDESTSPGGYVGGVAGWISTTKITLTDCDNAATVSAKFGSESRSTKVNRSTVYIGGIAGGSNSEIILNGCDNAGNVINNCPANAAVAKTAVAGVIGFCNSHTTMTDCTTSGNVTNNCNDTKNEYFGGLAGQIEYNKTTKITGCTVTANLTVKVTTRDANHFSGILVGRLTDKVDGSNADATVSTTIQNVTVKGGSYNGTALTAENLGTYTFGHASNYGGKLYTKGGSYATTGITFAE